MTALPTAKAPQAPSQRIAALVDLVIVSAVMGLFLIGAIQLQIFGGGPLAVALAVAAIAIIFRVRNQRWASIGMRRAHLGWTVLWTVCGVIGISIVSAILVSAAVTLTGEAQNLEALEFVKGNLGGLLMMLAIGWTTAGIDV